MSSFVTRAPHPVCEAAVIIPVRNEEGRLFRALSALANQFSAPGERLAQKQYEVIVLLNNCRDRSAAIAFEFQKSQPEFALHVVERELPSAHANVGTARRLLMDEAASRLPARV